MSQTPCAICNRRRPERFCPAKSERICAICCGTERERTIDCTPDCAYLIKAHRYEREHRPPLSPGEVPFPDTEISRSLVYEQQSLLSGLAQAIAAFAAEHRSLADGDVLAGITSLAETYRTLLSGIYYEQPPSAVLPAALYSALVRFIQEHKSQSAGLGWAVKDSAIFAVLVYLARICRSSMNGRPRSRLFLEILSAGSAQTSKRQEESSRIIIP